MFAASPHEVYEALMDSEKHSRFTGCRAKISRKVGGSFTAKDSLRGRDLQLVIDRKIVQTWQCDYDGWPGSHFSSLTIRLKPVPGGTRLEFEQNELPAACCKAISEAWHKYYWQPLKKMLRREAAKTR
jgi:activator of HSP90 ATPase